MKSIEVEVRSDSGLHARPAADFVRVAASFASTIRLENLTAARPSVNGKSITSVLASGAEMGHTVRITAEGPDEVRAIEALQGLLDGLGEPAGEQGE